MTVSAFPPQLEVCAGSRIIGDQLSLAEVVTGLKAYKEVDERMVQLWHNLDTAVLSPRLNLSAESLPSIKQGNVSLGGLFLIGVH